MKFFVRYIKEPTLWSIINAQHFPAAVEKCKEYRSDCIVSKMDDKTITPNAFIKLTYPKVDIEAIAEKFIYELQYQVEGEKKIMAIECAEYELEKKVREAMNEPNGYIFAFNLGGSKQRVMSKKVRKQNVPICIIINKGVKKKIDMIKENSESDHPSGLSGEHNVVLDAIQRVSLGGI